MPLKQICKALGCKETVQSLDPGLEFISVTTDLDKGRSSCHMCTPTDPPKLYPTACIDGMNNKAQYR